MHFAFCIYMRVQRTARINTMPAMWKTRVFLFNACVYIRRIADFTLLLSSISCRPSDDRKHTLARARSQFHTLEIGAHK